MTVKKLTLVGSIVTTAALAASLSACSTPSAEQTAEESAPTESQQVEAAPEEEPEEAQSDYAVTLDSATAVSTYDGQPAIAVTYTFTNNSDSATMPASAVHVKAFQNGVELETAIVTDVDMGSYTSELKPGATATCTESYLLADQSDVTVEAKELISFSDELLAEKVFKIA